MPLVSLKETSLRSSVRGSASTSHADTSFSPTVTVEEDRRLLTVIYLSFVPLCFWVTQSKIITSQERFITLHTAFFFYSHTTPNNYLTRRFSILSYMHLFSQLTTACVYDFTNLGGSHCADFES